MPDSPGSDVPSPAGPPTPGVRRGWKGRPPGPAVPAVLARSREEKQALERKRQLFRSAPALIVAVALHGALVAWALWFFSDVLAELDRARIIEATLDTPPDIDFSEPEEPEPELEEPPDELLDPETSAELVEADPIPDPPAQDVIGLGAGALGGGGLRGFGRKDPLELISGLDIGGDGLSAFQEYVEDLRDRGLDVVFVIDATASMDKFIAAARAAVDGIISDLDTVVPDLRLGIVAFRDTTDDWLTRTEPLTKDRYRIQNFLAELDAYGGGDFEEAVDEGLRVAIEEVGFRDGARRVIILVGDAPYHDRDESSTLQMVRRFSRDPHSLVNVLYTGVDTSREPTSKEVAARKAMDKIVQNGEGLLSELVADRDDLRPRIIEATFGSEWYDEIQTLVSLRQTDRRQRIVERKIEREDRKWLARQLSDRPLHPGVVDGAIELFDGVIARAAFDLLTDEAAEAENRSAALFILKRCLRRGAELDLDAPLGPQQFAVDEIEKRVEKVKDAQPEELARPQAPVPVPAVPSG